MPRPLCTSPSFLQSLPSSPVVHLGPNLTSTANPGTTAVQIAGHVHGGQQPVSGAIIKLYTVGTSGDGSASTSLLSQSVTTDANGNFSITNLYSCTNATLVYLVAAGGNPGLSSNNSNLALMTTLGPCASLTSSTFVTINQVLR